MTSNLGAEALVDLPEGRPSEDARDKVMESVKKHFSPELLNRVDDVVLFNRLRREDMSRIVEVNLKKSSKILCPIAIAYKCSLRIRYGIN